MPAPALSLPSPSHTCAHTSHTCTQFHTHTISHIHPPTHNFTHNHTPVSHTHSHTHPHTPLIHSTDEQTLRRGLRKTSLDGRVWGWSPPTASSHCIFSQGLWQHFLILFSTITSYFPYPRWQQATAPQAPQTQSQERRKTFGETEGWGITSFPVVKNGSNSKGHRSSPATSGKTSKLLLEIPNKPEI